MYIKMDGISFASIWVYIFLWIGTWELSSMGVEYFVKDLWIRAVIYTLIILVTVVIILVVLPDQTITASDMKHGGNVSQRQTLLWED